MELIIIIIGLLFLGVIFTFIEFAVLPGLSIAGIISLLCFVGAIYLAAYNYGWLGGLGTTLVIILVEPFVVIKFFNSKAGRKAVLQTQIDGKVNINEFDNINIGDKGKTVGRLAPVGKVRIGQCVVEGKSVAGFVNEDTMVRVIEKESSYIVVEPIEETEE